MLVKVQIGLAVQPRKPKKLFVQRLDINYTEEDVSKAIDEININAGTSEDSDIPARIYKNFKDSLLKPIHIWSKSFADRKVPSALKIQHINPVHKGGAKTDSGLC